MSAIRERVMIQLADVPNKNGRIYPRHVLLNMLQGLTEREPIKGVMGASPDPTYVHMEDVSHQATNFSVNDVGLVADVEVLSTPKGLALREILKQKEVTFGIRGLVNVRENVVHACAVISIDVIDDGA